MPRTSLDRHGRPTRWPEDHIIDHRSRPSQPSLERFKFLSYQARHLGALLMVLLVLSGCGDLAEQTFRPLVIDDAGLLDSEAKIWLENFSFPRGYALVVRTVDQETQHRLFLAIEEESPIYAFLIQSLGTQAGSFHEISQDDFLDEPFTSAYFMPGVQDAKAAVAWSVLAYLFLPRPLALVLVFLWIFPALGGIISTAKAATKQPDRSPGNNDKHGRMLLPAAIMLTLVILFGISATRFDLETSANSGATESLTTQSRLTLRGIGPIRIGMNVEEARQALGGLQGELPGKDENPGDCYYISPLKGPTGISFMVVSGHIVRVDVASPSFETLSGAHIGDRESHVLDLYRGRLDISPHKYDENGHYLTFSPRDNIDKDYRLIFETDGKTITTYRAGKLPEVEFVEGCL